MGFCGYKYLILRHFVVGHIIWCANKTPAVKMPVDKTSVKISREDKMLAIFEAKIYCSDGQVN